MLGVRSSACMTWTRWPADKLARNLATLGLLHPLCASIAEAITGRGHRDHH
jgi:hypothetical protein